MHQDLEILPPTLTVSTLIASLRLGITDPVNDSVYIGLSGEADDFGIISGAATYTFRILDPTGAVIGPFVMGRPTTMLHHGLLLPADLMSMAQVVTARTPVTFPYSRFKPIMTGDYVIQFDECPPFEWYCQYPSSTLQSAILVFVSQAGSGQKLGSSNTACHPELLRSVSLTALLMACSIPIRWMDSFHG
ncbi:MAG: hypothetical protein IPP25_13605 [Saprospiraceae bacterium]|nr:hypothetical protein [Candidatus Opimibacter skivensis]